MRKLASIQRIWKIEPIEGADRIELAHVLGWQCVVNKGQFQPMDIGVYFEIDSFLPIRPVYEFMRFLATKRPTSWAKDSSCAPCASVGRFPRACCCP